jgi:hypothetical protein
MNYESTFGTNTIPNPRNAPGHYDVGLMQVATNIWDKSPYTDGLPNAYGTLSADARTGKMLPFDGDPLQNVRLGARALNASSGRRGRPRDVLPRADAAGIFRAGSRKPSSYRIRVNEFNKHYRDYDRFFNCMRGLSY